MDPRLERWTNQSVEAALPVTDVEGGETVFFGGFPGKREAVRPSGGPGKLGVSYRISRLKDNLMVWRS